MQKIHTNLIIPLNAFDDQFPIEIDVVYAQANHPDNHFPNLYSPDAQIMWAHKDIAAVTLLAAKICNSLYGWTLKINDSLRPVEAQEGMALYGYHPSLVSTPGSGAHPRAMAIDIEPLDKNGERVPMGTPFDYFSADPENDNPAARNYTKFDGSAHQIVKIWHNRQQLEFAMRLGATLLGQEILPLPQEFWDFREHEEKWTPFAPLTENDLLPCQRLIDTDFEAIQNVLKGNLPEGMSEHIDEVNNTVAKAWEKTSPQDMNTRPLLALP